MFNAIDIIDLYIKQQKKTDNGFKSHEKKLRFGLKQTGGRNSSGRKIFRRAALTKKIFRFIEFKRRNWPGLIGSIIYHYLYDPNRTGLISLILFSNGVSCYILAPQYGINQKYIINLGFLKTKKEYGWSNYLELIPAGSIIYSVEPFLVLVVKWQEVQVKVCSFKKRCSIS